MGKLEISARQEEQATVLTLEGVLDTETAKLFDTALTARVEDGQVKFAVDLKALSYISSAGIGVLVGTLNQVRELGGAMLIVHLPPKIERVLDMLDILDLFEVFTDEPSALARLA